MSSTKYRILLSTVATVTLMLFSACDNKPACPTFTVKGKIENAAGKSIYLSNIGINGNIILDSAKIDKNGLYTFSQPQPASYDFFFIAINGKKPIPFAIDSTETVTINSNADSFYESYTVEGNNESKHIKEMNELQAALEKQVPLRQSQRHETRYTPLSASSSRISHSSILSLPLTRQRHTTPCR